MQRLALEDTPWRDAAEAMAWFERVYGPFALRPDEPRCGAADPDDPGVTCTRQPHLMLGVSVGAHAALTFGPDGRRFECRMWNRLEDPPSHFRDALPYLFPPT